MQPAVVSQEHSAPLGQKGTLGAAPAGSTDSFTKGPNPWTPTCNALAGEETSIPVQHCFCPASFFPNTLPFTCHLSTGGRVKTTALQHDNFRLSWWKPYATGIGPTGWWQLV